MKLIKSQLLLILFLSSHVVIAAEVASPYLKILNKDASFDRMPLLMTTVDASITGLIVEVKVTQIYKNNGTVPLEAQYVFPGSRRAAVHQVTMKIEDRLLQAEIKEKQQARKIYQTAKKEGKTTSLLEQKDPGLFTMMVANIMPEDEIEVELVYSERLIPENGKYTFNYPAIGVPSVLNNKKGYDHVKNQAEMGFDMIVKLNSPIEIADIKSTNHKVDINYLDAHEAQIVLDINETLNFKENFIIEYSLIGNEINTGILLYEDSAKDEGYFLMMIEPPKKINNEDVLPREYIFVMDSSGSMEGKPLEMAQEVAKQLLSELKPNELFNVILFAGGSQLLNDISLSPTQENIKKANNMVDVSGAGGGTNLLSAIQKVEEIPLTEGYSRSLIVLTDGGIDVSLATMDLIRANNHKQSVFAIGVSRYNNDLPAIEQIAQAGNGQEFIINDYEKLDEMQQQFLDYVRYPLLTNIKIKTLGFEDVDLQPSGLPDLFSKRPLFLTGKYKASSKGSIEINGLGGSSSFSNVFDLARVQSKEQNKAIKYLWAKEKVIALGDGYLYGGIDHNAKIEEITALGLEYDLLTAYTSFVAVDKTVRNTQETKKVGNDSQATSFDSAGYGSIEDNSISLLNKKLPTFTNLTDSYHDTVIKALDKAEDRPSITFILGKDTKSSNQYYTSAMQIFAKSPIYKTDVLVTNLSSIAEVKNYLRANKQQTWGVINIVTHSSTWSGLSVKLNKTDNQILDVFSLNRIISDKNFQPLSNAVVDKNTEIRVLGCALGKHQQLLKMLSMYFGGKDTNRPMIKSPKDYVFMNAEDLQIKTFENGFALIHPRFNSNKGKLFQLIKEKNPSTQTKTLDQWKLKPVQISTTLNASNAIARKSAQEIAQKQQNLQIYLQELGAHYSDFSWSKSSQGNKIVIKGKALLFTQIVDSIDVNLMSVLDMNDDNTVQIIQTK